MNPRRRRLNSSRDVRRYLADIAYRVEIAELTDANAKTLVYILNTILTALKTENEERELEALEKAQEQLKGVR